MLAKRTNNRTHDTCQTKSDWGPNQSQMVGSFMMDHTTSMANFSSKMLHTTSKKFMVYTKMSLIVKIPNSQKEYLRHKTTQNKYV
eukprot:SAG25_NODE_228_length_11469_cov_7.729903_1_plen_85_part_00